MDYLVINIIGTVPTEDLILLKLLTVINGNRGIAFSSHYTGINYNDTVK